MNPSGTSTNGNFKNNGAKDNQCADKTSTSNYAQI